MPPDTQQRMADFQLQRVAKRGRPQHVNDYARVETKRIQSALEFTLLVCRANDSATACRRHICKGHNDAFLNRDENYYHLHYQCKPLVHNHFFPELPYKFEGIVTTRGVLSVDKPRYAAGQYRHLLRKYT